MLHSINLWFRPNAIPSPSCTARSWACERSGKISRSSLSSIYGTAALIAASFPLRRFPAPLCSRSTWFFDPRLRLRAFDLTPAPLRRRI